MKNLARLLLIVLLSATGCTTAGTHARYNPETHEFTFDRPWLGGPVSLEVDATLPDGTVLKLKWMSDVNLDAAQAVRLEEVKTLNRALELAAQNIPSGG